MLIFESVYWLLINIIRIYLCTLIQKQLLISRITIILKTWKICSPNANNEKIFMIRKALNFRSLLQYTLYSFTYNCIHNTYTCTCKFASSSTRLVLHTLNECRRWGTVLIYGGLQEASGCGESVRPSVEMPWASTACERWRSAAQAISGHQLWCSPTLSPQDFSGALFFPFASPPLHVPAW